MLFIVTPILFEDETITIHRDQPSSIDADLFTSNVSPNTPTTYRKQCNKIEKLPYII